MSISHAAIHWTTSIGTSRRGWIPGAKPKEIIVRMKQVLHKLIRLLIILEKCQ